MEELIRFALIGICLAGFVTVVCISKIGPCSWENDPIGPDYRNGAK